MEYKEILIDQTENEHYPEDKEDRLFYLKNKDTFSHNQLSNDHSIFSTSKANAQIYRKFQMKALMRYIKIMLFGLMSYQPLKVI